MRSKARRSGQLQKYLDSVKENLKFNAEFITHSAGIEGNTITEDETMTIITCANLTEVELKHSHEEIREVKDLHGAVDVMMELIQYSEIDEEIIKALHVAVTASDSSISGGSYKLFDNVTYHNGVMKKFTPAEDVEESLFEMCDDYNNSNRTVQDICRMLLRFINIHPFTDGNGRVHRLLINWALLTNDYIPVIIRLSDKKRYVDALHEFGECGDTADFRELIEEKLIEGYTTMLEEVLTIKTNLFK